MIGNRQLLLSLVLLGFTGCSRAPDPMKRPVFPATGVVTYRGQPLIDAVVRLHPVGQPDDDLPVWIPRGRVGTDGTFAVSTYRTGDGAPAGEYRVSFSWQGPLRNLSEQAQDQLPELMPRQLTSPHQSGITVVVAEGTNEFPAFAFN